MVSQSPARPQGVIRRGSDGTDAEEFERFLQVRVALFVRAMAALFAVLYVGGVIMIAAFAPDYWVAVHAHIGKILNLIVPIVLFAVWRWVRVGRRLHWQLRAVDAGTVWLIISVTGIAVGFAPGGYLFETAGLLMLVTVMIFRSALVPSSARFTAIIGLVATPPLVLGAYAQRASHEIIGIFTPPLVAGGVAMWCIVTTAAAALVSREIYGLVAQVRKAMQLGRYTLREKIGEGGMGAVYRAEHAMLRRKTAIKLLLPDRVSSAALVRFEREVQLTSQLSHPNTIAIHDYGRTPEGVFYYAMELLDGRSLEQLVLDEGAQPAGRVVHVLLQVAGSLREAHAAGLIHRDIKPSNILIGTYGGMPDFVKVIDFGLVKQLDAGADPAVTRSDTLTGTPLFMAPESITRPESIDAMVDTYAFGATAYYLITGTPVFDGRSMVEVCGHHMHTPPALPSERLGHPVPPRLEQLILRCLAKDPKDRPTDPELSSMLRECERESAWDAFAASRRLSVMS